MPHQAPVPVSCFPPGSAAACLSLRKGNPQGVSGPGTTLLTRPALASLPDLRAHSATWPGPAPLDPVPGLTLPPHLPVLQAISAQPASHPSFTPGPCLVLLAEVLGSEQLHRDLLLPAACLVACLLSEPDLAKQALTSKQTGQGSRRGPGGVSEERGRERLPAPYRRLGRLVWLLSSTPPATLNCGLSRLLATCWCGPGISST